MRTPIIVGNWKMNKTMSEALDLVKALYHGVSHSDARQIEIVVAPPYTALNKVAEFLKDSFINVSAQDMFWEESGAFTGEISAAMIKDAGAKYVIIGHSERRQLFHETNSTVNKKIKAALKHNIIPILCIGETLEERKAEKVNDIIEAQFSGGLMDLGPGDVAKIVIAYEPIWAIGTGRTASSEQAEEVHAIIRRMLVEQFGQPVSDKVSILYGGSVKPTNSRELLSQANIDGALIGGASLKSEDFIGIITSVLNIVSVG